MAESERDWTKPAARALSKEDCFEMERGRYQDFYVGVRDWLAGDGPPPVDPADSVDGLRVLEAARRSAAMGDAVEVR